ncbi:hypothetical protein TWF696_008614 [Orbilia brochopaga]|uniref:Uncharacterized protein n=1 Tax=Orbilia brochopaga TaxID=3140254 RepID=A0AAV9UJS9_9PEZI
MDTMSGPTLTQDNGSAADPAPCLVKLSSKRPEGRAAIDNVTPRGKPRRTVEPDQGSATTPAPEESEGKKPRRQTYRYDGRTFSLKMGKEILGLSEPMFATLKGLVHEFFVLNPNLEADRTGKLSQNPEVKKKICDEGAAYLHGHRKGPAEEIIGHLVNHADVELASWALYSIFIEIRRLRIEKVRAAAALAKKKKEKDEQSTNAEPDVPLVPATITAAEAAGVSGQPGEQLHMSGSGAGEQLAAPPAPEPDMAYYPEWQFVPEYMWGVYPAEDAWPIHQN